MAFGNAVIVLICGYGGIVVFAYYYGFLCDPIDAGVSRASIVKKGMK